MSHNIITMLTDGHLALAQRAFPPCEKKGVVGGHGFKTNLVLK